MTNQKSKKANSIQNIFGMDGCRGGWFAVGKINNTFAGKIFPNIDEFHNATINYNLFIDIPIGLPSKNIRRRSCDEEARKILRPLRHNSVFWTPCRDAINIKNYDKASQKNFEISGFKLSQQAFSINSKISEIDNFIIKNDLKDCFYEIHPEICFWSFNNEKPMSYSKKSGMGFYERLEILKKIFETMHGDHFNLICFIENLREIYTYSILEDDDILDALIAYVTGIYYHNNQSTIPKIYQKDEKGIKMCIHHSKIS
jgi:predicted RNase H-like nuclease